MTYIALLLILTGLYLVDSGLKNRAPIGFLRALVSSEKPDLYKTLAEYNGKWTTPLPADIAGTVPGGTPPSGGSGVGLPLTNDPRNGRLTSADLDPVSFSPGQQLAPAAALALSKLNQAYKAEFGNSITISDSYRSYAAQVATKALKGDLAATPGQSNHGLGLAVDLGGGLQTFGTAQHNWMLANAPKYGWVLPSWAQQGGSKPEAWHWEYVGGSS